MYNNGVCVNVTNDDDVVVAPRGHTKLLECAKKHACKSCTDAQDCIWHENHKEVQPIDLKLALESRSSSSPDDDNAQSTMKVSIPDFNSAPCLPVSNY